MIKQLNMEEEIAVIKSCDQFNCDNGSSRLFSVGVYNGKKVAVKMFLDRGGYKQTRQEIEFYETHSQEERDCIVDIYAYGSHCIICELVDPLTEDDQDIISDLGESGYEQLCDSDMTEDEYMQCYGVYCTLCQYYGDSSDNAQIGYSSERGRYVAYDFGYNTSGERNHYIGNMGEYRGDFDDLIEEILKAVINDYDFPIDYYNYYYEGGEYNGNRWDDDDDDTDVEVESCESGQ